MATQVKTGLIANNAITDAKIANVALTGVTASSGDSSTSLATTAFVAGEINSLIDSAPGALNTLNELAAAMGDDANFSTTVTNSIATKLPLAGGTMTGDITASQSVFNITNNDFRLKTSGAETMLRAVANGAVELMHNNVTKIQTTADGVSVTGTISSGAITSSSSIRANDWYRGASNTNALYSDTSNGTIIQTPSNTNNAAGTFFVRDSLGAVHFSLNTNTNASSFHGGTISSGAITTSAAITSTAGATAGSRTFKDDYVTGSLANQGFLRSSGGNYWGYSTYQEGSTDWKSATSIASERTVYAVDEDTAYWSYAPSQTVSIGSNLTTQPTKKIVFDLQNTRVGIGTDTPTLPFEAHGANNNTFAGSSLGTPGTILVQGTDVSGSGYAGGGILFAGDYHTNGSTTTFAAIAGIKESTTNGEYAGALTFGTREGGTGAGNFERMRISSVGNVSVGTSSAFGQTTNRTCFTINGTSSTSLNIGVGAAQKGYLYTDGNMTQLGSVTAIPLKFAPNDSPKMELAVSGELSMYGNKMVIDSDYGHWSGKYQHLTCHNAITSSNTWTDVAYVSYSPSLTIQGMAQRDNNGALGASNFLGTIFGGYGATAVVAERSVANPMNGGGFGALEYRYLNSGASSGNYRLQVRISKGAGTMYVTTTLTGHAWQEIYED